MPSLVIASHDTVGGATGRWGPHVWPPAHLLSIDVLYKGGGTRGSRRMAVVAAARCVQPLRTRLFCVPVMATLPGIQVSDIECRSLLGHCPCQGVR